MSSFFPSGPVLRGLVSQSSMLHGVHSDLCPRFGLFEPVYETAEGMFVMAQGGNGFVTGFRPLKASAVVRGLVPFGRQTPAPSVNDPIHVGLLCHKPDGALVGVCAPWDDVATFACGEAHSGICEEMRRHPLEGYHLARFLTVDVSRYVEHAVAGGGFDFEARAAELRAFASIRDELRGAHPEWRVSDMPARRPHPVRIDPTLN